MDDLLLRIQERYPRLSPGYRSVAQVVVQRLSDVAFMTAQELAVEATTSPSTVVRFAQDLGYQGYPDFLQALQQSFRSRLSSVHRLERTLAGDETTPDGLTHQLLAQDLEALSHPLAAPAAETLDRAVEALAGARIVYLMGSAVSTVVVDFLAHRLNRAGKPTARLTQGGSELLNAILPLTTEDVLVAVALFRPHPEVVLAAEFARRRGAALIALTDQPLSEVARRASVTLSVKPGPLEVVNSLVVPMSVANALAVAVAKRLGPQAREAHAAYERLRAAWEKVGAAYYETPGRRVGN